MGYESKIIIVERTEHELQDSNKWVCGGELARFDLSKMGYDRFDGKCFTDLFTVPIDFDLYVNQEQSDELPPPNFYREDCYGEHCKYTADLDGLIGWLEQSEEHEHYRRAALFLDFLRVLKDHKDEYNEICLVHYGY